MDNTGQSYPPNSIIHKFIKELRRSPTIEIKVSTIFLDYNEHIQQHGQNVVYTKSPYKIYKFLKKSGVDPSKIIAVEGPQKPKFTPITCAAIVNHDDIDYSDNYNDEITPSANAAIVSSKIR